jgi:hypothetical protein
MCFLCAEAHIEAQHTVILQNDALVNIPAPALELSNKEPTQVNKNALEVLNLLNQGSKIILRLNSLHCPCGRSFNDSPESALCCVCVSATCSDECHRRFVQERGLCRFALHQTPDEQRSYGCSGSRCITKVHIDKSITGAMLSLVRGPRFLVCNKAINNCLLLGRGYSQFGQPLLETLREMEALDADPTKSINNKRRCLCQCPHCTGELCLHPTHICESSRASTDDMQQ